MTEESEKLRARAIEMDEKGLSTQVRWGSPNKSTSAFYHLPDSRPHKTRCGQDRVTPLGPVRMADRSNPVSCSKCIRFTALDRITEKRGGDWIRG